MKAKYKNVTIIGTSHIAPESVKEVEATIKRQKPMVVALELDRTRLYSLLGKKKKGSKLKELTSVGLRGFLFNLIGAWIEQKLGKIANTPPGSEMKIAVKAAREVQADLALIDQDVRITLRKISKRITWREKGRFVGEIGRALFKRNNYAAFDMKKVPPEKVIKKITKELKLKYPSLYEILIKERNEYMASVLKKIATTYPNEKIVAVVGAGHVSGIKEELQK